MASQFKSGCVIWITGLSGAGKTTIASRVTELLRTDGCHCVLLDAHDLRQIHQVENSGYDWNSRLEIVHKNVRLFKMIADQGIIVVVATMSLFHEIHAWNRTNYPRYIEVFVDVPIEILKERNPRGLYAGAIAGKIENVAGINMDFEKPLNPDIVLDNSGDIKYIESLSKKIISFL